MAYLLGCQGCRHGPRLWGSCPWSTVFAVATPFLLAMRAWVFSLTTPAFRCFQLSRKQRQSAQEGRLGSLPQAGPSSTTVAGPDDYTCTQTRRHKGKIKQPGSDYVLHIKCSLASGFTCCIATTSGVTPPHSSDRAPVSASAVLLSKGTTTALHQ